jgi:branched-subunit amino acid transport protein AzlD
MKKFFLFLSVFILIFSFFKFLSPNFVFAADTTKHAGLVKCGLDFTDPDILAQTGYDTQTPCQICDITILLSDVINFLVTILVPSIATLLFLIAGFMIILGGASPGTIGKGKTMFKNTVIGLLIVYSSWLIANTILQSLAGNNNISGSWFTIVCKNPSTTGTTGTAPIAGQKYYCNSSNICVADANGSYTTSNCDGKCQSVVSTGTCTGQKTCSDAGVNVCQPNTSASCYNSAVNQWNDQIIAGTSGISICSGIDTVKMIKAIMSQESNGVTGKQSFNGSSYGIMQLRPDTANAFKSGCTTDNIDAAWLLSSDKKNIQASICIAANFIRFLVSGCGCDVRQLAAGYNGGANGVSGACDVSSDCGPSAGSGTCSVCANQGSRPTKRWECLYEDTGHTSCNIDRVDSSGQPANFSQTRVYAPKVEYCYGKF